MSLNIFLTYCTYYTKYVCMCVCGHLIRKFYKIKLILTINKVMKNGKIVQFIKEHYVAILSVIVVIVSVGFGLYRCSKSVPISFNATRNRTTVVIENPFTDSVKPKK